jgi:DNA topoisomerase-6 subunit B
MRRVVLKKSSAGGKVMIHIDNYTTKPQEISLYDISGDAAGDANIPPSFVSEMDGEYTKIWKFALASGEAFEVTYTGLGGGMIEMQGVSENLKVVVDLDV